MASTYTLIKDFQKRYKSTLSWWRIKKHAKLVDKNLHKNEEVLFAFAAQITTNSNSIFNTAVLALTTSRLIIAQERLLPGYMVVSVTPDLYNDITIEAGVVWGTVKIDTLSEMIQFSNISKDALTEIQTTISSYMIDAKKSYARKPEENS